jgi:hypothetical protein
MPELKPGPPRGAASRAGYAQLLFLGGVLVSGVGLFVADEGLRRALLWGGALVAGAGLLIQPLGSAGELRLRLLLGLALLLIVARILTGYQSLDPVPIGIAVLIGAVAAWMRYGPRRR